MFPPFDIFRLEKDALRNDFPMFWIAAASTLEEARSHIQAAGKPGTYTIRSTQTENEEYITVDGGGSTAIGS